jgi:hypothetical protein
VEAVCYRSWGQLRAVHKAERPDQIRPTMQRMLHINARMLARLEALHPPRAAARRYRRALAVLRARRSVVKELFTRYGSSSLARMSPAERKHELQPLAARDRKLGAKLDRLAPPMGLHKCTK